MPAIMSLLNRLARPSRRSAPASRDADQCRHAGSAPGTDRGGSHLFLGFNDITEPTEGLLPPGEEHVRDLLRFVGDGARARPMVIH
jgi:hypothetical protein